MECTCSCGATSFQTIGEPLFRFYCHCTICQRFNDAPFADIVVFRAEDVVLPPPEAVIFDTYRPPPNVQRGKCAACGQPAVTVFNSRFLPRLVTVPRPMFGSDAELPSPMGHGFYETRVSDARDSLPKYEGYFRNLFVFLKHVWLARRTQAKL